MSGDTQHAPFTTPAFQYGRGSRVPDPAHPPVLRVTRLPDTARRLALLKIRRWRQTVPYTAPQIAAAIRAPVAHMPDTLYGRERRAAGEQYATFVETTDIFTRAAVTRVLPWLATTCAVCGAVAHYHVGWEGRCVTHRHITNREAQRQDAKAVARGHRIESRSQARADRAVSLKKRARWRGYK